MLTDDASRTGARASAPAWVGRVLRVSWLGQTIASLCWISSVFAYGISSTGDSLQLCAAGAWLIANIASAIHGDD